MTGERRRPGAARGRAWLPLGLLAACTYLPLLATEPGRVVADTKTYLYLDPGRLLSRAWSMWDPNVGLGTVSHQTIGYLWPMGPWYWALDAVGVPDWVAQRLWLGTILFAAGAGTYWLARRVLGWRVAAAGAAAFVYACTPYVLTLAARLSVILLPYTGLPWLLGLCALALRSSTLPGFLARWRHPAAFALVVATVGSVNATALVLAGLGPLLWVLYAVAAREATAGHALRTVARIGVLCVAANLWWVAGLWAQGGFGIEILRYTETAKTVAMASVAAEVLRGLGYWFFYGGDRLGPWIEPGRIYTQSLPLIALTYLLPIAALLAGAAVRWRERGFFVVLLVVGTLTAVGAHPWGGGVPGPSLIEALLRSDAGLAMRSLPRAAPLVALAVAMLLGAGVAAAGRHALRAAVVVSVAAYAALPPLWALGMVPENLDRDEELPGYWLAAAAHLDAGDRATRVLELPGSDFASYRWGNTVDPITPGLIDRPYVARELIPYGSPPSAELLGALDVRFQERNLDLDAVAVVARLLGVGEVVHRADLQFERYRTPRPYDVAGALDAAPGLGDPVGFGAPTRNEAIPELPMVDELALLGDDGEARPPVEAYPVEDPVPIVRAKPTGATVVVAGDGESLVDLAGSGLLDGTELVRYAADLGRAGVAEALAGGATYVVTDGNRRQGQRWSTVRDVLGFVEGEPIMEEDPTDNRLPVFPDAEDGWETTAERRNGVRVTATAYGNAITFTPEFRPANVADGDVTTEWRIGANEDVRGDRLRITYPAPIEARSITFVQQLGGFRNRHITEVAVHLDGRAPLRVALDESSRTPEGQRVVLPDPVTTRTVEIEILAESSGRRSRWGRPLRFGGLTQVGFAEVRVEGAPEPEREAMVLPPAATDAIPAEGPVALVLTRWWTDPSEVVRDDPEPALVRRWSQPVARTFELTGSAKVSPRAPDFVLDALFGTGGPAVSPTTRLPGAIRHRGVAALDGDPTTWWSPRFGDVAEPAIRVETPEPVTISRLHVQAVDDGRRSVPTTVRVEVDGRPVATVEVGRPVALPEPVTGTEFRFVVAEMEERRFTEWYSDAAETVPPAIAELGVPELAVTVPEAFPEVCRDDLLALDGEPLPVLVRNDGRVEACGGPVELGPGEHELASTPGSVTGIDIDQVVLAADLPAGLGDGRGLGSLAAGGDGAAGERGGDGGAPRLEVVEDGRWRVRVAVRGAEPGEPFWLVLGQSHNLGWELDGREPELVDGYANGWLVTPTSPSFELTLTWWPQRVVNAALWLSAVGGAACLALVVLGRLRAPRPATAPAAAPVPLVDLRWERGPRGLLAGLLRPGSGAGDGTDRRVGGDGGPEAGDRRLGWAVVGAALALSAVWIGPVSAVVVTAAAAGMVRRPALRRAGRLAPAAVLGLVAAYVAGRQAVDQPAAAFEWPAELAAVHQPALVAVALLAVVVALDAVDARARRRAGPPAAPASAGGRGAAGDGAAPGGDGAPAPAAGAGEGRSASTVGDGP